MKKILSVMVIAVASVSLMACAPSVKVLKKDADLRHSTLKECVAMGMKAKHEVRCINATKAQAEVAGDKVKDLLK